MNLRRPFRGLDEMAIETAFIGLSALVFIVVASWALRSDLAHRLDGVPIVGTAVDGLRALVGQVTS